MFSLIEKIWRWYFIYLVLILHFCCFQSFKELVSVCVETDCKVTTFFWIDKIFQKKYLLFLFNHLLFNSQATSLDCGCKVTAFSQTTKIFLSFFWNFFITCCTSKRKILNILHFIRFLTAFWAFWGRFYTIKNMFCNIIFRVFRIFRVFSMKI